MQLLLAGEGSLGANTTPHSSLACPADVVTTLLSLCCQHIAVLWNYRADSDGFNDMQTGSVTVISNSYVPA